MFTFFNQRAFFVKVRGELYRRGLGLGDVVEMLGISRTTLWRWQEGRGVVPTDVAAFFCAFLDINMNDYIKLNGKAIDFVNQLKSENPERF